MKAHVDVDAGVCGFHTKAVLACDNGQHISSCDISSDCENITCLAQSISLLLPLDSYLEISPVEGGRLLACCRDVLKGCCSGCAVPVGLFKAMQIAAGLALPKDVHIRTTKE